MSKRLVVRVSLLQNGMAAAVSIFSCRMFRHNGGCELEGAELDFLEHSALCVIQNLPSWRSPSKVENPGRCA